MHFWISKGSGSYGSGRYGYPSIPLPKTLSGNTGVKYPPDRGDSYHDDPPHPRAATRSTERLDAENINTESILLQPVQQRTDNQLVNNITASRELPGFSDFTDEELAGFRLCCGIWMTSVLAAGFIVTAKFYLDHSSHETTKFDTSLEILVYCVLLVTLLLSGWFFSILHRRIDNNVLQVQHNPTTAQTEANTIANESIEQNPQLPLHHLAIFIPPSHLANEIPPLACEKVAEC